jgi:hypothetical protein
VLVTEAPLDHFPHSCALTGRDDGPVIDTGRELEMHPNLRTHLYLRADALRDLAREHLEMVPVDEVRPLAARVEAMDAEIRRLTEQVDVLTQAKQITEQLQEA